MTSLVEAQEEAFCWQNDKTSGCYYTPQHVSTNFIIQTFLHIFWILKLHLRKTSWIVSQYLLMLILYMCTWYQPMTGLGQSTVQGKYKERKREVYIQYIFWKNCTELKQSKFHWVIIHAIKDYACRLLGSLQRYISCNSWLLVLNTKNQHQHHKWSSPKLLQARNVSYFRVLALYKWHLMSRTLIMSKFITIKTHLINNQLANLFPLLCNNFYWMKSISNDSLGFCFSFFILYGKSIF